MTRKRKSPPEVALGAGFKKRFDAAENNIGSSGAQEGWAPILSQSVARLRAEIEGLIIDRRRARSVLRAHRAALDRKPRKLSTEIDAERLRRLKK
jgi:hypothetical protein